MNAIASDLKTNQAPLITNNTSPADSSTAIAVAVSGDENDGKTTLFSPNTNTMNDAEHIEELEADTSL
jgi:hypothetical protein